VVPIGLVISNAEESLLTGNVTAFFFSSAALFKTAKMTTPVTTAAPANEPPIIAARFGLEPFLGCGVGVGLAAAISALTDAVSEGVRLAVNELVTPSEFVVDTFTEALPLKVGVTVIEVDASGVEDVVTLLVTEPVRDLVVL